MVSGLRLLDRRERAVCVLVAAAGAVFQLDDRVKNSRRLDLPVYLRPEARGVAAGAIGLVRGELPSDRLVVGEVAARAGHARVVLPVER